MFDLITVVPIVYPRKIGSLAKFDLPKYLRGQSTGRPYLGAGRFGDTNRLSSSFRTAAITERILSPDLAGSDSTPRVLTTPTNYSAMQDGTFNGKGRNERGTVHTSTFIHIGTYTGKAMNESHACMYSQQ